MDPRQIMDYEEMLIKPNHGFKNRDLHPKRRAKKPKAKPQQLLMDSRVEINIQRDRNFNVVTIDDKVNPKVTIETTLVNSKSRRDDDLDIKLWADRIRYTGIIGISVDCSRNYKNGSGFIRKYDYPNEDEHPIEAIQLCIEDQCLIYEPHGYYSNRYFVSKNVWEVPKALNEILSNDRYSLVGVGIEKVAKQLESQLGLKISRPRDLGEIAGYIEDKKINKSLEKLANKVLGGDWKKPEPMCWWDFEKYNGSFSDDKIKYGTMEAFLAYKIASKLIYNS